jgi:hypothetical protein
MKRQTQIHKRELTRRMPVHPLRGKERRKRDRKRAWGALETYRTACFHPGTKFYSKKSASFQIVGDNLEKLHKAMNTTTVKNANMYILKDGSASHQNASQHFSISYN